MRLGSRGSKPPRLEAVLGFGVLKLDVQTVLDAHLHLDCVVRLWQRLHVAHPEAEVVHDAHVVWPLDRDADHVPEVQAVRQ
jgi:hypothetical protein